SRHVRSPRFVPTTRAPPTSTLFPYTTLFRSQPLGTARADSILAVARIRCHCAGDRVVEAEVEGLELVALDRRVLLDRELRDRLRSEEHTSELQSRENLVCRLLLEKKNYLTMV